MSEAKRLMRLLKNRRSIRRFSPRRPSNVLIRNILEAGRWAPSGLNNQPWRFIVVTEKAVMGRLGDFTTYANTIRSASLAIVVFLDNDESYDREKDIQAVGACIQNMLLFIHASGIGACWLGEILNKKKDVSRFLEVPPTFELMAVIAVGYPISNKQKSSRRPLSRLISQRI